MFGKVFESIYDGTLVADWRALVTFQQMIVLCDSDGVVDMTPHAIAARTGIPIEHIEAGLRILENPDPYSRTPDNEGRRIELIDDHRPWGWIIVNHAKYKYLLSREDKRQKDRLRMADKRERMRVKKELQPNENEGVADSRTESQIVADVAHTNTDANADTNTDKGKDKELSKTKTKDKKPAFELPLEISDLDWDDFEEHRKKLRKPLTDRGRRDICANIIKCAEHNSVTTGEVVGHAILSSWIGIGADWKIPNGRPLPQSGNKFNSSQKESPRERAVRMNDELQAEMGVSLGES